MPKPHARLYPGWAISSVVERFLHTEEATGSIPVSPTMLPFGTSLFLLADWDLLTKSKSWTEPRISATLLIVLVGETGL